MYEYFWHVSNISQFATSILHILIKEQRTAHRERWNQNRSAPEFKSGYAVKAHVQVQSKSDTEEVVKLVYRSGGPFQIKTIIGNNSYEVQLYTDPKSGIRNYKGSELYFLPPFIFSHEPIDTMYTNFLNYSNSPIASPRQKSLKLNYITTTSSNLIHFPPFNLQETKNLTLLTMKLSSHTHSSQTRSQISRNSGMHKRFRMPY